MHLELDSGGKTSVTLTTSFAQNLFCGCDVAFTIYAFLHCTAKHLAVTDHYIRVNYYCHYPTITITITIASIYRGVCKAWA